MNKFGIGKLANNSR